MRSDGSSGGLKGSAGGFAGGFGWIRGIDTSCGTPIGLRASFDAHCRVLEKEREGRTWKDGTRKSGMEMELVFVIFNACRKPAELDN